jgi:putative SOS response-associated peptidase YedK
MCGRFLLNTMQSEVARAFDVVEKLPPRRDPLPDIRPTQTIAVVRSGEDARVLVPMRWGFMPDWYAHWDDGPLLINARSETIAEKPAFRAACRARRCLIPANGFYEWQSVPHGKRVHHLAPEGEALFGFAGIWQQGRSKEGRMMDTVAIVTCAAPEPLSHIHARMPVVIPEDGYGLWLGEAGHGAARLMAAAPDDFWQVTPDRGPPDATPRLL